MDRLLPSIICVTCLMFLECSQEGLKWEKVDIINQNCKTAKCPLLTNCNKVVTPTGECCPKCACSRKGKLFGYTWIDENKACQICRCMRKWNGSLKEQCKPYICPDQAVFMKCRKPVYNYYCGCILSCDNSIDPPKPTFPPAMMH